MLFNLHQSLIGSKIFGPFPHPIEVFVGERFSSLAMFRPSVIVIDQPRQARARPAGVGYRPHIGGRAKEPPGLR